MSVAEFMWNNCVPQAAADFLTFGGKLGTPDAAEEELVRSVEGLTVEFVYHKM